MKKKILALLLGALLASCSLFTKENVKTVLDVAKVTCIIANVALDDEAVAKLCDVIQAERPAMQDILGKQRAALSKAGCHQKDGGQ